MANKNFKSGNEVLDLVGIFRRERESGATGGGIFGSRVNGDWCDNSDIDVVIDDPSAPPFGEIEHEIGERSGSIFHIFRKKPGKTGGKSRREEILDTADDEQRKLF